MTAKDNRAIGEIVEEGTSCHRWKQEDTSSEVPDMQGRCLQFIRYTSWRRQKIDNTVIEFRNYQISPFTDWASCNIVVWLGWYHKTTRSCGNSGFGVSWRLARSGQGHYSLILGLGLRPSLEDKLRLRDGSSKWLNSNLQCLQLLQRE